ncbi:MAG: antibiotic biosynthesis monooxygenase [Bacteroidota bacterium]
MIALTPMAPYYAVVFTTLRTEGDNGYSEMAAEMEKLAKQQPGYLGIESARNQTTREGITVSYWESLDAIKNWKMNADHQFAQQQGKEKWYAQYKLRICKVERDYGFGI